jgi:hypothetical protein
VLLSKLAQLSFQYWVRKTYCRTFDKHSATYCAIHIALCNRMCITAYVLLCKLWQQHWKLFVVINYKSLGNISYLENTNIDIVKSLIISFDYVNWMTYLLITFSWLSNNLRQHAMLFLFLGIVHSSEVADYLFNIEYEKRIAEHSTNIALHIVHVNWMTYLLITFSWLSNNLNTVPIEENNVNISCSFQCCCQSLHNNTYAVNISQRFIIYYYEF